jgi:hypothetical protein
MEITLDELHSISKILIKVSDENAPMNLVEKLNYGNSLQTITVSMLLAYVTWLIGKLEGAALKALSTEALEELRKGYAAKTDIEEKSSQSSSLPTPP